MGFASSSTVASLFVGLGVAIVTALAAAVSDAPPSIAVLVLFLNGSYCVLMASRVRAAAIIGVSVFDAVLGLYGVYYVLPCSLLMVGWSTLVVPLDWRLVGVVWCAVASLVLGFLSVPGKWFGHAFVPPKRNWRPRDVAVVSGAVGVLGLALLGLFVSAVGFDNLLSLSYVETHSAMRGKGFFFSGFRLLQVAILVVFAERFSRKVRRSSGGAVLALLGFSLALFRIGRRRFVFETLLGIALAKQRVLKARDYLRVVVAVTGLLGIFAVVGQARAQLSGGVSGMVEFVNNDFTSDWLSRLTNEPVMVLATVAYTIRGMEGQLEYSFGRTLVDALGNLVPSFLVNERPVPPSLAFAQSFDPAAARLGAGFGYSIVAEGYLNAGLVGVVIFGFALGVLLRSVDVYVRRGAGSAGATLVQAAMGCCAVMFVRSDISGLLKEGVVSIVFPAIAACLWCEIRAKRPERFDIEKEARIWSPHGSNDKKRSLEPLGDGSKR